MTNQRMNQGGNRLTVADAAALRRIGGAILGELHRATVAQTGWNVLGDLHFQVLAGSYALGNARHSATQEHTDIATLFDDDGSVAGYVKRTRLYPNTRAYTIALGPVVSPDNNPQEAVREHTFWVSSGASAAEYRHRTPEHQPDGLPKSPDGLARYDRPEARDQILSFGDLLITIAWANTPVAVASPAAE